MSPAQISRAPQSIFPVARTSTVDLIAIALRNAIYSGALEVGAPIREVEMAKQLGVSRSPLREAAQRLVQERLLTAVPGRGLRVTKITAGEVHDLYSARRAVEIEAVKLLSSEPDPQNVAQLREAYEELLVATESADARAISDADINFHQLLVNLVGSRRLSDYMASLAVETRIAIFSLPEGFAVPAKVSATYETLLDALARGDSEGARVALHQQFEEAIARFTGKQDIDTVETPADEDPPELHPIRG